MIQDLLKILRRRQLIPEENSIELDSLFYSSSGELRQYLFTHFYEELLREYISHKSHYKVLPNRPKVYWGNISAAKEKPNLSYHARKNYQRLVNALETQTDKPTFRRKHKKSYTPDGLLLEHDLYYIVWEAKNWRGKYYAPEVFSSRIWSMPWLLAKEVEYEGRSLPISGFLISWWENEDRKDLNERKFSQTLSLLREVISPNSIEIMYTKDVLHECIKNKYPWYIKLIETLSKQTDDFFGILLGRPP